MQKSRPCLPRALVFLCSLFLNPLVSAANLSNLPGAVPLDLERQAASDLEHNGQKLQPDEARELARQGLDLSRLNPKTNGLLWRDEFPQTSHHDLQTLELEETGEELEFLEGKFASPGRVLFVVQKKFAHGKVRVYRLLLDDRGHNILARRTLLRKIGYNIAPVARLAKVRIKFEASYKKKDFVREKIEQEIFKDGLRWVVSGAHDDGDELTLQDLIVFPDASDWYYNFSRGDMAAGVVRGQRLINSLLLPFSLTDSPESLNVMDWEGASLFNRQVIFPHEDAEHFQPSRDDARWMARRLLRLSRRDWEEVGQAASMPKEPELLYIEKLVSRRNFYRRALQLESEFAELAVDYKKSEGSRLVEGKLGGGRTWDGYGRWFAGEDPESPLNIKEILAFLRSKVETNVLSNAVAEFNRRFVPRTDLGFAIFDHQLDLSAKQFADFLINKKQSQIPVGVWKTPYYNGDAIVAREVIPGSYMGSENVIQLADTVGFAFERGLFFWGDGLPQTVVASARAKMAIVVTSTHIKPVKSIRKSLDEPLSNILVPALKKSALTPIKQMLLLEERIQNKEFEDSDPTLNKEKQDKLKQEFKSLFESLASSLGPGESYLTSFSLSPGLDLTVGRTLTEDAQAYLRFQERLVGIYRVHLQRRDEKTVHLYINKAGYNELSAALGVKLKIPLMEAGHVWPKGKGKTYFYKFNLDHDLKRNPNFFKELRGVFAAVDGSSQHFLNKAKKPWELDLQFSDSRQHFNFLVWKLAQTNTTNKIEATSPDGPKADYIRRYRARRSGVDIENLLLNVANAIIEEHDPSSRFRLATKNSGHPGDTIFGRAVTREVISEARSVPGPLDLDYFFATVGYRWRGWEIKKEKVEAIFDEMEGMFGEKIFERPDLNETKEIQFYSIDVQTVFSRRAFERLLRLSDKEVIEIFQHHSRYPPPMNDAQYPVMDQISPWATWLIGDLKDLRRAHQNQKTEEFANRLALILDTAECQLTFDGFRELMGGNRNLFIQGSIRGFRDGAENATQDLRLNTIGEHSSPDPRGPLAQFQRESGVALPELLLFWLVNPL